MSRSTRTARGLAFVTTLGLVLAACGGGGDEDGGGGGGAGAGEPVDGGTLTFLTLQDQIQHLDPQRNYTGEDLAFANGYLQRTLTAYKLSPDGEQSGQLVGDLATDTGQPSEDAKTWTFTLKDGVTFEDGSPVTCADVKYGVSRTFATDIITDGPTYAISMLDIPKDKDGNSVYKGPYVTKNNDTAAFDKAVECPDDKTVVFHLAQPVGDFNYTVTLLAFSPVPKAADTGEKYDDKPVSSGPYKIQEYTKGNQLVLVRNENWSKETDDYRGAHPDRIVVKFGLDANVIDQRMIQDSGADQQALTLGDSLQPASLSTVFGSDRFAERRTNEFDAFVQYFAINTAKVPNLEHRKALAVAMDRAQERTIAGGEYAGDLADGVIKPNLPIDYAPSQMWEGLLGQPVPDTGDPEYAKQLIEASGEPMPDPIVYDYPQTPVNDKVAAAVVESMGKAGIKVRPNPIEAGQFYGIVLDPAKEGHLVWSGWGPDWSNASTIIPELFTPSGGFNLSQADDQAFNDKAAEAKALTDREAQATLWKELNKEAMANAWAIPLRFRKDQRLAGSKVKAASGEDGQIYLWAPFGSWPYGDLYVTE
jgi:peptide/nickel transport system substrate-binding protein